MGRTLAWGAQAWEGWWEQLQTSCRHGKGPREGLKGSAVALLHGLSQGTRGRGGRRGSVCSKVPSCICNTWSRAPHWGPPGHSTDM